MNYMWIVAQADPGQTPSRIGSEPVETNGEAMTTVPGAPANGVEDAPVRTAPGWMGMLPFLLIFVFMYLLLFRGPRKQQQQHKQLVQTLKKNDRVRTIGGIFGTIVDIRGDDVVLKVDESNNTKIRIATSAIGKNLSQEGKE